MCEQQKNKCVRSSSSSLKTLHIEGCSIVMCFHKTDMCKHGLQNFCKALDKFSFSISCNNKEEVKLKTVCVCVHVYVCGCLRTEAAGNIGPRPSLVSHWLCCCQAHLIRKQVAAGPIRTEAEFPLTCHSVLSVVTSHGPLNGRPQTQFKWPDETEHTQKNKTKKVSAVYLTVVLLTSSLKRL